MLRLAVALVLAAGLLLAQEAEAVTLEQAVKISLARYAIRPNLVGDPRNKLQQPRSRKSDADDYQVRPFADKAALTWQPVVEVFRTGTVTRGTM